MSFTAILNSNQTSQQEGNIVKKLGLSTRVFIGFGLGILLGVIFGEKVLVIKIIGDIFLKLIKMLTVPLVFFSIISGITNLTDVNKLKRVGAKILGMYVVTTLLAGFIGLGIAHLINPGVGFQIDSSAIGSYEATAMNSVSDTLLAMVPDNIINAMANTNMMGIIIFCAIFGCATVLHQLSPYHGTVFRDGQRPTFSIKITPFQGDELALA